MTASSTARVKTDRPGRYAKQLASHFSKKLETSWDPESERGHLTFVDELAGEVDMIAGDGVLLLHLECPKESVERLERVVGIHLVRFGIKDKLEVDWRRPGGVDGSTWSVADLEEPALPAEEKDQ